MNLFKRTIVSSSIAGALPTCVVLPKRLRIDTITIDLPVEEPAFWVNEFYTQNVYEDPSLEETLFGPKSSEAPQVIYQNEDVTVIRIEHRRDILKKPNKKATYG